MTNYDWENERGKQWLARLRETEAMLRGIDEPILSWLQPRVSNDNTQRIRIADIACGGGGTTFAIESLIKNNSVIHGFDISPDLILSAKQSAQERNSKAVFEARNLESSTHPEELYDVLVSRFGTMFFEKPELAFKNLVYWLKPGGEFLFVVWGDPKQNPWISLMNVVARRFIDLPPTPPNVPGPFRYADTALLEGLISGAGFSKFEFNEWRGKLPLGGGMNARHAAEFALSAFAIGEALQSAGDLIFNAAKQALVSELERCEVNGVVELDAFVHLVSGAR